MEIRNSADTVDPYSLRADGEESELSDTQQEFQAGGRCGGSCVADHLLDLGIRPIRGS